MLRGLKIREGFLAKHIFGFTEHKALEKSWVCQTQRAAARLAEPPSCLPRSEAGISGQEMNSTRGPRQPSVGLTIKCGGVLTLVWSIAPWFPVSRWKSSLSPPKRKPQPGSPTSLHIKEAHQQSPFCDCPERVQEKERIGRVRLWAQTLHLFSSSISSLRRNPAHFLLCYSGTLAQVCSLNLQMFSAPRSSLTCNGPSLELGFLFVLLAFWPALQDCPLAPFRALGRTGSFSLWGLLCKADQPLPQLCLPSSRRCQTEPQGAPFSLGFIVPFLGVQNSCQLFFCNVSWLIQLFLAILHLFSLSSETALSKRRKTLDSNISVPMWPALC